MEQSRTIRPSEWNLKSQVLTHDELVAEAATSIQRRWKLRRQTTRGSAAELQDKIRLISQDAILKKRLRTIRAKIREIVLYILFLYFYTISSHFGHDFGSRYSFTEAVKGQYAIATFDSNNGAHDRKSLDDVSTREEVFAWLSGPFLNLSYPNSDSSENIFTYSRVVGGIRLGQLRVESYDCSDALPQFYSEQSLNLTCFGGLFGDFDVKSESRKSFGRKATYDFEGWNETSTEKQRNEFFSGVKMANSKVYPSPAFSVVLPRVDKSHAKSFLNDLEVQGYLDEKTRVFFLDMNIYNLILRQMIVMRIVIEMTTGGGMISTIYSNNISVSKSLLDSTDILQNIIHGLVLVFYLYFLGYEFAVNGWKRNKDSTQNKGRGISLVRVLSFIFYLLIWLMRLLSAMKLPVSFPFASDEYIHMWPYSQTVLMTRYLLGTNTFLCWFGLISQLRVIKSIDIFVTTLQLAKAKLVALCLSLGLVFYGYANAFHIVLGADSENYRSIESSMGTLLLVLFGLGGSVQMSQDNVEGTLTVAQMVFCAFFLVFNVFFIGNLFLVIILEAYKTALDEAIKKTDQFNLIVETLNYISVLYGNFKTTFVRLFKKVKFLEHRKKSFVPSRALSRVFRTSSGLQKGAQLLYNQVDQLAVMGVQIVRNVVLDDEKEQERKTREEEIRKREECERQAERQMKLLQGMVLQLALQNDMLHKKIEEMHIELQSLIGEKALEDNEEEIRTRTYQL